MGEPVPATLGVVLAGGLARRMGGGDKPLRTLGGRPILSHALERLRPQVASLVLNANGDAARFAAVAPGVPVLPDGMPDHPGPLVGILAALDHAGLEGFDWVISLPGDTPFPPPDLVACLHAARRDSGMPLACASSGGWTHPPIGLWPVPLRDDLRAALSAGERKIDRWTARHGCAAAEWPVLPNDPFLNVNTPDDLSAAETALRAMAAAPTSDARGSGGNGP